MSINRERPVRFPDRRVAASIAHLCTATLSEWLNWIIGADAPGQPVQVLQQGGIGAADVHGREAFGHGVSIPP